jgi:hypothetical protein
MKFGVDIIAFHIGFVYFPMGGLVLHLPGHHDERRLLEEPSLTYTAPR